MDTNTWNMTLTVRINKAAVLSMREFLRQRSILAPMRDRDVVTKYLHRVIESGNARNCIEVLTSVRHPFAAPEAGLEGGGRFDAAVSSRVRQRLHGLGVDSFAALGLACIVLAIALAATRSPHTPGPWYDNGHASTSYPASGMHHE